MLYKKVDITFFTSHERFVLEINPDQRFCQGTTEIILQPLHDKITSIQLNCRQCNVQRAFVNDIPVDFVYKDPLTEIKLDDDADITHHQAYKSKYLAALRESDKGELTLSLPSNCIQPLPDTNHHITTDLSTTLQDGSTSTKDDSSSGSGMNFSPLTIRIIYTLDTPRNGIAFVEPDINAAPYRYQHVYTVNQPLPGATRTWLPCVDTVSDRCTWDMEFIVPRRMKSMHYLKDAENSYDSEEETLVICSGEMTEQVIHPMDASKKIVRYSLPVPTAAPFIGFAVGPFEMIKLTPSQLQDELLVDADLDENQQQCLLAEINMMSNIYAFALPGQKDALINTCTFLMHAMHFYGQEYGSYPFNDYKIVFIEDAWSDISTTASMSICSSHLLHPPDIIDQTYHSCRILSLALARQWFGVHISQKAWPDIWLICGLANLMASFFIKRFLGMSEYRLRLKRDIELCYNLDVDRAPLYNQALPSPLDPEDLDFVNLKAPLVLYMLDKRMCKGGSAFGLSRVISNILLSAMSGELAQNLISTHYFLKLCRKISGYDTRIFADQWIYKSGCPKFTFSYIFNRKKMVVEFYMKQENSNAQAGVNLTDYLATPIFTGNLTARIHEADGTPYEHILDIQNMAHKFEVQFNTKYKRIRRNTKRFLAKQAAAAAAVAGEDAENDQENAGGGSADLGITPMLGLGMAVFENDDERKEWHVAEWGQDEEDTSGAASATFDWIRLDAEFEWLCKLEFQQPDYMWAAQLTKDRDVVAQYEALCALKQMPSLQTSTSLLRSLLDPKCFYKIRMESAYALASCALPNIDWVGLLQLSKMFYTRYCFPNSSPHMDIDDGIPLVSGVPRPNDFSNLPNYFIQKATIIAFSHVRDEYGLVPLKLRQFLLDLLKYNDNTGNEFSDNYYVATVISALGDALIPSSADINAALYMDGMEGEQLLEAAKAEIERFRTLDYVVPSYHNVVTISCLQTLTKLMVNGLMDVDLKLFLLYTRYGNYFGVRCAAFDSLLVICGLSNNDLTDYIFSIIKHDPSVHVSHYVARSMLAWLGLAMKEKLQDGHYNTVEEFAEEEGHVTIQDQQKQSHMRSATDESIQSLRRRFENDIDLQGKLWDLLTSAETLPLLDHCIRKYLLQLCEYMYKPVESALKVTIRMPPTEVSLPEEMSSTPEEKSTQSTPLLRISIAKPIQKETPTENEPPKKNIIRVKAEPKKTAPMSPPPSSTTSPEPIQPTAPPTPKTLSTDQRRDCQRILGKLQKHRSALLFLQPVDENLDGAPDYYQIIKHPMDLGTVKTKVERNIYTSFDEFEHDIRLIFNNCYLYNRPGTFVYNEGQALESIFDDELVELRGKEKVQNITIVEAPTQNLTLVHKPESESEPKSDMEKCAIILSSVMENPHAFEFLRPVDPVKQGIPQYFNVIKQPMDLGTVKAKLRNHQYQTPDQFDQDVRLMLNNCYKFNPPQTYVYNEARQLEEAYSEEWSRWFGNKRKAEDMSHSHGPENINLGLSPISQDDENTEIQGRTKRRCERILDKLWNHEAATPFQHPVDTIALNIPDYHEIIKRPMDLSTIKRNLARNKYTNLKEFEMDVRQIFWNCNRYNNASSVIGQLAKSLEAYFNKQWANKFGVPGKLEGKELDLARQVISKLHSHDAGTIFHEPVDASLFPDYPTIVEKPIDLRTISEKLESGQYNSLQQVDDDLTLMFNNCYSYNAPITFVHQQGKRLERYYKNNCGKEMRNRIHGVVEQPTTKQKKTKKRKIQ